MEMMVRRLFYKFFFPILICFSSFPVSILAGGDMTYENSTISQNNHSKWVSGSVRLFSLKSSSQGPLGTTSVRLDGDLNRKVLHAIAISNAAIRSRIPTYLSHQGQPGNFYLDDATMKNGKFRRLINELPDADKSRLHAICSYIYNNRDLILSELKKNTNTKRKEFWSGFNRDYEIKRLAGNCLRGMGKKATSLQKITEVKTVSNNIQKCTFKHPNNCIDIVLCQNATTSLVSDRIWGMQPYKLPAIEEAKKRGLSCNVGRPFLEQLNSINIVFRNTQYQTKYTCKNEKNYIRSAQTKLSALGYYTSSIDGIFGNNTKSAYIEFENFLGDEVANVDGCLDDNEILWLKIIEQAKQEGLECDKPVFESQAIFSARDFLKKYEYFDGDFPTTQLDKRTFTEGIIRMEVEGKLHGDDFSKNCKLDKNDVEIILAKIDAEKDETVENIQGASEADLSNTVETLSAEAPSEVNVYEDQVVENIHDASKADLFNTGAT